MRRFLIMVVQFAVWAGVTGWIHQEAPDSGYAPALYGAIAAFLVTIVPIWSYEWVRYRLLARLRGMPPAAPKSKDFLGDLFARRR